MESNQLTKLKKEATELENQIAALALTHEEKKQAAEEIRQTQKELERETENLERQWFNTLSEAKQSADKHNNLMRNLTELDLQIKDIEFETAVAQEMESSAKPFITALTKRIEAHLSNQADSFLKYDNPVSVDEVIKTFEACLGIQGTRGGLGEATRRAEKNYQASLKEYFKELISKGKSEAEPFNRQVQAELDALLRNQFVKEMINGKRAIS